jgi:ubiquinone/menaquinone biosynthesis C-methylase UbiE
MSTKNAYSTEPRDPRRFRDDFDKIYTRVAPAYDALAKALPIWGNLLKKTLPYVKGPRVLEVSFGTGYLLMQYAGSFQAYGIDYNAGMVQTAQRNLARKHLRAG